MQVLLALIQAATNELNIYVLLKNSFALKAFLEHQIIVLIVVNDDM